MNRPDLVELQPGVIQRLRGEQRKTQEDLAHQAGISVRQLQNLEAGKTKATWPSVEAIAGALSVSATALLRTPKQETEIPHSFPLFLADATTRERLLRDISVNVQQLLRQFNIFTRPGQASQLKSIVSNPLYHEVLGSDDQFLLNIEVPRFSYQRLGTDAQSMTALHRFLDAKGTTTVLLPAPLMCSYILLHKVARQTMPGLSIDARSCLGSEVIERLTASPTHFICILPAGSTAAILATLKQEWIPVMLLPGVSHEILTLSGDLAQLESLRLLSNRLSAPMLFLSDLKRSGLSIGREVSLIHSEPEDILRSGDPLDASIGLCQWFPYSLFSRIFAGYQTVTGLPYSHAATAAFLFMHKTMAENEEFRFGLESAIRSAWLEALEDDNELLKLISTAITPEYLRVLGRCAGLFHLNPTLK